MATAVEAFFSGEAPVETCTRSTDLNGDTALAEVMREVGAALGADALIVAWHDGDAEEPMLLFTQGVDIARDAAERTLVEAASVATDAVGARGRGEWRIADGHGLGGELTTSIATEAGVVTITGRFNRLSAATKLRARDTVARLLPMVRPFVQLWATRRTMMSRVRGLTAAVNQSDFGILLVNRLGQLLFANDAAEALLAARDGIRCQGRMLYGAKLADTMRLQAAIEHAISSHEADRRGKRPPVIALTRQSRRPLLAAIMECESSAGPAEESAAIIYLCDPDQDLTSLVEPICKLYRLSPVECRLACLLARGMSLGDAAAAMRVREQTARSYLKQIFLKTETRRQAELVWLMLKSAVHTSANPCARLS